MCFGNANHRGNTTTAEKSKWTSKTHTQIADVDKKKWLQIKRCCLTHCVCLSLFIWSFVVSVCLFFSYFFFYSSSYCPQKELSSLSTQSGRGEKKALCHLINPDFNYSTLKNCDWTKLDTIHSTKMNVSFILFSKIGQKTILFVGMAFWFQHKSVFQATEYKINATDFSNA